MSGSNFPSPPLADDGGPADLLFRRILFSFPEILLDDQTPPFTARRSGQSHVRGIGLAMAIGIALA
ncbi:MAG TPA: hypothetical protein VIL18_14820 [Longimicrobiales bacterium]